MVVHWTGRTISCARRRSRLKLRGRGFPAPAKFSPGPDFARVDPAAQPRLGPALPNLFKPHRPKIARANFRPDQGPVAFAQSGCRFASRTLIAHAKQHPIAEFSSTTKKSRVRYRTDRAAPLSRGDRQNIGKSWPLRAGTGPRALKALGIRPVGFTPRHACALVAYAFDPPRQTLEDSHPGAVMGEAGRY